MNAALRTSILIGLGVGLAACGSSSPRATAPGPTGQPAGDPTTAPPALDWAAAGIDWTKPPPSWAETPFVPPTAEKFALANGITVYVIENHRLPLVSVRFIHHAAGSRNDGAQPGIASLTADLLDEGAGARSALELTEELERLGASLSTGAGTDSAMTTIDGLVETLDGALAIAADVVLRPRFTDADFARVKTEQLDELALRVDRPRAIAGVVFDRVAFGSHPYGTPGSGWIDSVTKLDVAAVKAFWKASYGPTETSIVVAGDVTRAELEPALARHFGAWKNRITPGKPTKPASVTPPTLAVVDMPGRPQTVVTIGRLGPDSSDPTRAALDVANTALGGSFASRLNARLREQLGYTYGIFSTFERGQWAGAWSASSSIRTDVTGAAVREALSIIAETVAAPLPADELDKAKALITRGLPAAFETNASTAGAFATLVTEGQPLTFWRDRIATIEAVTADAARAASAGWWKDLSIVVVGDWSAIGKDLEALGLPITRYNEHGQPLP